MTRSSSTIDEVASKSPGPAAAPAGCTLEELLRTGGVLGAREVARLGIELARVLAEDAEGNRASSIPARELVIAASGRFDRVRPGVEGLSTASGQSDWVDAPLYAAPETLRGEQVTQQGTVYGVGVVLYRLLTGAFPVSAQAVRLGQHAEAWDTREDLRGSGSRVPLPLALVVERAIDPRPESRYATLEALCADLEEAARHLGTGQSPARRRLWHGVWLVAVIAIAAVAWVVAHAPSQRPTVAVRFDHDAGSNDAAAIVDGMTIEMTRLLAQAEGLDVRAARPASRGQRPPPDAFAFGVQHHASFVLIGSVGGEAGAWRQVEVSLVRVRDKAIRWSDSFSLVDGDIFAAQERIAAAVADTLQVRLSPRLPRYSTRPRLQEEFLRARSLQATGIDAARQQAAEILRRVVEGDPNFVPASAALATTLGGVKPAGPDLPPLDARAATAGRAAYAADPDLAESNAAMGLLSARLCQWDQGKTYFRQALMLDRSVTSTYVDYAFSTLLPLGETRDAIDVLDKALEVDPMSPALRSAFAHVLVESGEYDRAIEMSRSAMEDAPALEGAHQTLIRALYLTGRMDEAVKVVSTQETLWAYRGYIFAMTNRPADAMVLADAHPDESARQMLIYAGLKDVHRTVDALQRTARLSPWRALTWMERPEIEPVLRGDARAAALRDRLRRPGCGA